MRRVTLLFSLQLMALVASQNAIAQELRVEAESGVLNGFSIVQGGGFSGGARINGDVANPTATYTFPGANSTYDVVARYCDEDDGNSSYELSGSIAGVFASWNGDQPTGSTTCSPEARLIRTVATSVELYQDETITFDCQRDPGEPCRVDYFEFTCAAQPPPSPVQKDIPPGAAFPGAVGFGLQASGARRHDAEVCVVTNLNNDGAGSFRSCAQQCAPAYITFAVSGYIDLSEQVDIGPYKTIECATAPGDGVVFRKSRLHVVGNNVILRGCRAWPGSEPGGQALNVRDGIVVGNEDATVDTVIVANNSVMFGTDENAGTYNPVNNVTLQHNISAWALRRPDPGDPEARSFGMLISQGAANVSVVENFLAFNRGRNPRVAWSPNPVEVVNNLVYCHAYNAVEVANSTLETHVTGNRFKGRFAAGSCSAIPNRHISLTNGSVAYASDNTTSTGSPAIIEVDGSSEMATEPRFAPRVIPVLSEEVEARVFAKAGPARLIAFEIDAFTHYVNGTGEIIDTVDDLGGWPVLQGGAVPPDTNGNGMPDAWETEHCGGPCEPTDDHDHDGYENIEEWFHSFYADS